MIDLVLSQTVNIWSADARDALPRLRADFRSAGRVNLWIYLLDPDFFLELTADTLQFYDVCAIIDHRQATSAANLAARHPRLHCARWSGNRTMHTKTLLFPSLAVTWFTTANLTRGSWTLSSNHCLRIQNHNFSAAMGRQFYAEFQAARPLLPRTTNTNHKEN